MEKVKVYQFGLEFLVYLSLLFIVLISPIKSYVISIVGLSSKIWLLFLILLLLGVVFCIFKMTLGNLTKTTVRAGIIAGLIIGIGANLPRIMLLIMGFFEKNPFGIYYIIPALPISLFIFIFIGFLQSILMNWYKFITQKRIFIMVLIIIFMSSLFFLGKMVYQYNHDLDRDCPDFKLDLEVLSTGSPYCLSTAATERLIGSTTKKIPELGIQFEYPRHWGEFYYYSASGKAFEISADRYNLEKREDRLVGGGATEDFEGGPRDGDQGMWASNFNPENCTFVLKKRKNPTISTTISLTRKSGIDSCAGVEYLESELGTIYYYHVPASYPRIERIEFSIIPNEGIAIIPLPSSDYKILLIKKLLNTPEKEQEFKKFLQSFKPLS